MSSQHITPPPVPVSPPSTGVRRHHTITAASRTARADARQTIAEESQDAQPWNDDELVDQDWVGGVGAVGEKTSLHRQSSLPTSSKRGPSFSFHPLASHTLHTAFRGNASKSGNLTPRTLNSLSAIAGNDGDEEDWEREMRGYNDQDEVSRLITLALVLTFLRSSTSPRPQTHLPSPLISPPPMSRPRHPLPGYAVIRVLTKAHKDKYRLLASNVQALCSRQVPVNTPQSVTRPAPPTQRRRSWLRKRISPTLTKTTLTSPLALLLPASSSMAPSHNHNTPAVLLGGLPHGVLLAVQTGAHLEVLFLDRYPLSTMSLAHCLPWNSTTPINCTRIVSHHIHPAPSLSNPPF